MGQNTIRAFFLVGVATVAMAGCKPRTPICGDAFCDPGETCASCAFDCNSCTSCGDNFCAAGETCALCPRDCGSCTGGCGDGACGGGETCTSCPADCGGCTARCGDGSCTAAVGETCSTCPGDCGACGTSGPYGACTRDADCSVARDSCISVMRGGVSRSFCGVRNCRTDTDCDLDMYGSPGLCVSFSSGAEFDCFHRCNTTGDCPTGYTCGPTDGSATTMVCLPGSSSGSVPAYRVCSTSADCAGGLTCIPYYVGAASTQLCSRASCITDSDCPLDMRGGRGACLSFGGVSACWERCNVRGDCANTTQFDCTTNINGNIAPVPVCVVR